VLVLVLVLMLVLRAAAREAECVQLQHGSRGLVVYRYPVGRGWRGLGVHGGSFPMDGGSARLPTPAGVGHHGLLVSVPSGEIGVVDRADIADSPLPSAAWPVVEDRIIVVGAGYTSAWQLRLSARPSDVVRAKARME
jgi:hypothetical protein